MSNTLEETKESLRQRFVNVILENNGTVNIPMVDALNGLILSEAQRIGMEAIGIDDPVNVVYEVDGMRFPKGILKTEEDKKHAYRNDLRKEQRERLYKLTGVEGSKEQ